MRKYITTLVITLALLGCQKNVGNSVAPVTSGDTVSVVFTPELTRVYEESKKMTQSDRSAVLKQYLGISEYIKNSNVDRYAKIDPISIRVQGDYGYARETYPTYSDAISAYITANGLENDVVFSTREARLKTAKVFSDAAEAIKKADKEQKAKE